MKKIKKKISGMIIIATLTIVATIGVSLNLNKQNLMELLLGNIEALAMSEVPPEVSVQCLWEKGATCVVGRYVVNNSYYNPH